MVAEFNLEGFAALSQLGGVHVINATVNDSDIRRINRRAGSHLVEVQNEDSTRRWVDYGYFLVWPVAALTAFWFRKSCRIKSKLKTEP